MGYKSHALTLVKALKQSQLHDTLGFPSPSEKVLSDMTLTALLRRVKAESDTPGRFATDHGFRSSFRDWASEHSYARDLLNVRSRDQSAVRAPLTGLNCSPTKNS